MSFTTRLLDPGSDTDLECYADLDRRVDLSLFGACEWRTTEQDRTALSDTPYRKRQILLTFDRDGTLCSVASLQFPLLENTDTLEFFTYFDPRYETTQVVESMTEAIVECSKQHDRSKMSFWGVIPALGEVDDPSLIANQIALRLGMTRKNVAVCRAIRLPLDAGRVAALSESITPRNGYRIVTWRDRAPEEYLTAVGLLKRQADLDSPDEDYESEVTDYTPERLRHHEQRMHDQGITAMVAMALDADGSPAGYTELVFNRHPQTTLGWQEYTVVLPGHRGHGLGLSMKLTTHMACASEARHLRLLATWNSHVNPQMIAINAALGYEVKFREVCYQD